MKDAIVLDNVSKRYGPKEIIHNISFKVGAGEIVGFLGPNGAGKTTTMKMIAGSTAATSGKVEVSGINMATRNYEAAKKIGKMVGEFNKAKNEIQNEMKDVKNENIEISGPVKNEREKLEVMAKTIGIDSDKKTDDELRTEISSKIGQKEIDKQ